MAPKSTGFPLTRFAFMERESRALTAPDVVDGMVIISVGADLPGSVRPLLVQSEPMTPTRHRLR